MKFCNFLIVLMARGYVLYINVIFSHDPSFTLRSTNNECAYVSWKRAVYFVRVAPFTTDLLAEK